MAPVASDGAAAAAAAAAAAGWPLLCVKASSSGTMAAFENRAKWLSWRSLLINFSKEIVVQFLKTAKKHRKNRKPSMKCGTNKPLGRRKRYVENFAPGE
jgi:hypothetical protein